MHAAGDTVEWQWWGWAAVGLCIGDVLAVQTSRQCLQQAQSTRSLTPAMRACICVGPYGCFVLKYIQLYGTSFAALALWYPYPCLSYTEVADLDMVMPVYCRSGSNACMIISQTPPPMCTPPRGTARRCLHRHVIPLVGYMRLHATGSNSPVRLKEGSNCASPTEKPLHRGME